MGSRADAATCTLTSNQHLGYAVHTALRCLVIHMGATGRRSKSLQLDKDNLSCGRSMYTNTELQADVVFLQRHPTTASCVRSNRRHDLSKEVDPRGFSLWGRCNGVGRTACSSSSGHVTVRQHSAGIHLCCDSEPLAPIVTSFLDSVCEMLSV